MRTCPDVFDERFRSVILARRLFLSVRAQTRSHLAIAPFADRRNNAANLTKPSPVRVRAAYRMKTYCGQAQHDTPAQSFSSRRPLSWRLGRGGVRWPASVMCRAAARWESWFHLTRQKPSAPTSIGVTDLATNATNLSVERNPCRRRKISSA